VTVRPELVDALDPHEVPACLPGEQTDSPSDVELYFRGYIEVPNCCPDGSCGNCQGGGHAAGVTELPGAVHVTTPVPSPAQPLLNESGMNTSATQFDSQNSSYRAVRPVNHSISGRQIRRTNSSNNPASSNDDPGLFGRVGYDVLEYKQ
jgi:pilus assembly protein CpaC